MKRNQKGFSLIEVLISVLVISVGVLGIVALQVTSTVYAESSIHRGQASMLAREIVERMRVNTDESLAGNYDINTLPALTRVCTGAATDCSPSQIREHDLRSWSARVAALLPGSDASIVTDTSVDPVSVVVTLSWTSRRSAGVISGASMAKQQTFTFQLHGLGL